MEILLYITSICFAMCYIPQIIKIIKTRSVDDISIWLFTISMVGYLCGLIYFILNWKLSMLTNYGPGLIFCIWIVVMYFKFKKKGD